MSSTEVLPSPPPDVQRPDVSLLGREFVLTSVDQENYWQLLVQAFPTARLFIRPQHSLCTGPAPPEFKIYRSLSECPPYEWVTIIFDPDWTPRWGQFSPYKWWGMGRLPYPNAKFERNGQIVGERRLGGKRYPPTIYGGRIYFRCDKSDRAQIAWGRKGLRLLTKVASNRLAAVKAWTHEVVSRIEKGADLWIGHDAARWCREHPDHILLYDDRTQKGIRPLDCL